MMEIAERLTKVETETAALKEAVYEIRHDLIQRWPRSVSVAMTVLTTMVGVLTAIVLS